MQNKLYFIYKTTCIITNKFYIGMHGTNNIDDGYYGSGTILRKSIQKHGIENHIREVLEYAKNREELCIAEKRIIQLYKGDPLCTNLADGGIGGPTMLGKNHSNTSKNKISNSLKGRKHTEETKKKIGEASKGRTFKLTDETKKHLSAIKKGIPSKLKGVERSEETKKKISDAAKNRPYKKRKPMSEETKLKIGNENKRRTLTEAQKMVLSVAHTNKIVSEETKLKLSLKAKEQWKKQKQN